MAENKKLRYWLFFVAAAVLFHVVLLMTVKPSFFSLFKKSISAEESDLPYQYSGDDMILTISIEVVDNASQSSQPEQVEEMEQQEDSKPTVSSEPAALPASFEDLVGDGSEPITRDPGPPPAVIPPRPVEITWPDTRKLAHCVGVHVTVHIQVDEKGKILQTRPEMENLPEDCVRAALEAAEKIVFEPARVNGIAVKMWTHVRIDFRLEKNP